MSEPLWTLAYLSRSLLDSRDSFAQLELLSILLVSRIHNVRSGVTGCLLLNHGCFSQVVEGSRQAVETTFERVECDPRHRSVSVLYFRPLEKRLFPEWSMAHASADRNGGSSPGGRGKADLGPKGFKATGDDLADVLRSLVIEEFNAV